MSLAQDPLAFTADAAALATHIQEADLIAVILTCAHLSGQPADWLRPEWRPANEFGILVCRLDPAVEAEIRAKAAALLAAHFAEKSPAPAYPTRDLAQQMAHWMMGDEPRSAVDPAVPLACEEIVYNGIDPRKPKWNKDRLAPQRALKVVLIGAGESGILTAHRLNQAGVPFTIYEKNSDVGGTWFENRYPGCRVDCNSYFYSFGTGRADWKDFYGHATDVGTYLREASEAWQIRDNIRFNHEVEAATWDAASNKWHLVIRTPDGSTLTDTADIVVSAVGQLNRPMVPDFKGKDRFKGPSFHTARWDHSVDYAGKRIGIIGTGATALQIVPQVAKTAAKVTVIARTTPWLLPTELLHATVPDGMTWMMQNVPAFAVWYRYSLAVPGAIGMLDGVIVDPAFNPTETSVSAYNDRVRANITAWMDAQITDRPDLREFLVPLNSPPGGKRIVRDNGTWAKTLKRDNVQLVKAGISEITETGLIASDGSAHEFDILVYATGFHASKFLLPMTITGMNGTLEDLWDGDARAYLGMTVPGFPNFFIFYGPNTNQVVHGGSAFLWSEFSTTYLLSAIEKMLANDITVLDVKPAVYDSYNDRLDRDNLLRAWGFSKVNSWYKNAKGRVTQNWPYSSAELWSRLKELDLTEFETR